MRTWRLIEIVATVFVLAGIACFGLFEIIGSTVAPDGRLQEPFALLPVGWVLILLGGSGLVVSLLSFIFRKH